MPKAGEIISFLDGLSPTNPIVDRNPESDLSVMPVLWTKVHETVWSERLGATFKDTYAEGIQVLKDLSNTPGVPNAFFGSLYEELLARRSHDNSEDSSRPTYYPQMVEILSERQWSEELLPAWRATFGESAKSGSVNIYNGPAAQALLKMSETREIPTAVVVQMVKQLHSFGWNKDPFRPAIDRIFSDRKADSDVVGLVPYVSNRTLLQEVSNSVEASPALKFEMALTLRKDRSHHQNDLKDTVDFISKYDAELKGATPTKRTSIAQELFHTRDPKVAEELLQFIGSAKVNKRYAFAVCRAAIVDGISDAGVATLLRVAKYELKPRGVRTITESLAARNWSKDICEAWNVLLYSDPGLSRANQAQAFQHFAAVKDIPNSEFAQRCKNLIERSSGDDDRDQHGGTRPAVIYPAVLAALAARPYDDELGSVWRTLLEANSTYNSETRVQAWEQYLKRKDIPRARVVGTIEDLYYESVQDNVIRPVVLREIARRPHQSDFESLWRRVAQDSSIAEEILNDREFAGTPRVKVMRALIDSPSLGEYVMFLDHVQRDHSEGSSWKPTWEETFGKRSFGDLEELKSELKKGRGQKVTVGRLIEVLFDLNNGLSQSARERQINFITERAYDLDRDQANAIVAALAETNLRPATLATRLLQELDRDYFQNLHADIKLGLNRAIVRDEFSADSIELFTKVNGSREAGIDAALKLHNLPLETRAELVLAQATTGSWKGFRALISILNEPNNSAVLETEPLRRYWKSHFGIDSADEIANVVRVVTRNQALPERLTQFLLLVESEPTLSPALKVKLITGLAAMVQEPVKDFDLALSTARKIPWNEVSKDAWTRLGESVANRSDRSNALNFLREITRIRELPDSSYARIFSSVSGNLLDRQLATIVPELHKRGWNEGLKGVWDRVVEAEVRDTRESEVLAAIGTLPQVPDRVIARYVTRYAAQSETRHIRAIVSVLASRPWSPELASAWNVIDQEAHAANERKKAALLHATVSDASKIVIHEPLRLEALAAQIAGHCTTEVGRLRIQRLLDRGQLATHVNQLLLTQESSGLNPEIINNVARLLLAKAAADPSKAMSFVGPSAIWPRPTLPAPGTRVDPKTADSSMIIIGDGPAAITMGVLRHSLGYGRDRTTIISPSGKLGGIWTFPNVVSEGHNTFNSIEVLGHQLRAVEPRSGADLQTFLERLQREMPLETYVQRGSGRSVKFDPVSEKYQVNFEFEGNLVTQEADSVLLCTGNRFPRQLNDGPMQTNANVITHLGIARWQEQIKPEDYPSFHNTRPIIVGFGNSAIAMIGEFMKMREVGIDVNPVILTHYSQLALDNPTQFVQNKGAEIEGPLFRGRFNLTKIAGDIPRIRERYDYALRNGWVVAGVRSWNVGYNGEQKRDNLNVQVITSDGKVKVVDKVPKIWALIGYKTTADGLEKFGVKLDPTTELPLMNPLTGQAQTSFKGDPGRLYIAGNAASRPGDRNQEVIPGMLSSITRIAFSEIVNSQPLY